MIADWGHRDKGCCLYFEMCAKRYKSFSNSRRTIPVIIDFWDKEGIERFKKLYADCPYLLVTSLEVLNFLKTNQVKNNLIHFPMTLPSMYRLNRHNRSIKRSISYWPAGRILFFGIFSNNMRLHTRTLNIFIRYGKMGSYIMRVIKKALSGSFTHVGNT